MKSRRHSDVQNARGGSALHRRRGAFFIYVLIYMVLASALLAAAGVCLHAVLRSDDNDQRASMYLNTYKRMEMQLRKDHRACIDMELQDDTLVFRDAAVADVIWTIKDNLVTRSQVMNERGTAQDRFTFERATLIRFVESESLVAMRVEERQPMWMKIGPPDDTPTEGAPSAAGSAAEETIPAPQDQRNLPENNGQVDRFAIEIVLAKKQPAISGSTADTAAEVSE